MNRDKWEKKKVLFVDDEINILKALRRELFNSDFEVLIANSAVEGLEILKKEKIAIVVSDVKMPNIDGLQFLKMVKERYPDINRVILSGFVEQSSVVSSIIRGIATTYFAKPWDTEVLRKSIEHILDVENILHQKELLSVINSIEKLPTLPLIYDKFVKAMEDDLSVKKIAQIIDEDVSLSTRILRVANSAFYGNMKISSVERAIIHLGINIIKDIVLTVSITSRTYSSPLQKKYISDLFVHSSLVNQAIRQLFKKKYGASIMEDFSSVGITHDIGKIILIQYLPQRFQSILEYQKKNEGKTFYQCELELGYEKNTHSEIGAYFLSWWNLPVINVEVSMYHHVPEKSSDHFSYIVKLAGLADELINFLLKNSDVENLDFSRFISDLLPKEELERIACEIKNEINGKFNC
jgi:HD-like signal output (HDOD) protein